MLPVVDDKPKFVGRLGKGPDAEAGRDSAYTAALNVLVAAKEHLGSLDRVTRVIRLGMFIATLRRLLRPTKGRERCFGSVSRCLWHREDVSPTGNRHRQLPLGVPIELDIIFEVKVANFTQRPDCFGLSLSEGSYGKAAH
jgi:hypothetical protein